MKTQAQLSIVIVNWNSGSQLAEAVASVTKYHDELVASVVIVDNASIDHSLDQLEAIKDHPFDLQIIRNNENRGFAAACNAGAALGGGDLILFLNPDAAVFANTIRHSVEFMRRPENAGVGICGVQLVDATGRIQKSCAKFPDAKLFFAQASGLAAVWPARFGRMMTFDHQETRDVDQVMGAYFLIRRSLFEKAGGFDERFFVYYEELDLSLRTKKLGWRSVFLAQARAFHKGGGVSGQVKAHRMFYSLRSRILYAFKHFSRAEAWAVFFVTLAIEPVPRVMRGLFRRSGGELVATIRGCIMLWREVPDILRQALRSGEDRRHA